jgi:hypothetical protein
MPNHYSDKIAKFLRVDKHVISDLEEQLNKATGKPGVLKKIVEENEKIVDEKLSALSLNREASAQEVYDALISKIESDDLAILNALNLNGLDFIQMARQVVDFVKNLHHSKKGYVLKMDKARELLMKEPPKKILVALGYKRMEDMLMKEDLLEVFSALRFLEDADWLNNVFFKQYESLTPDDFEERYVQVRALDPKWAKAAEKFVTKKYHNVSHLKELGVIFVIPIFLKISGETLRLISLLLHYSNEVEYYSEIFRELAANSKNFAKDLISLLRGDVLEKRPTDGAKAKFLIVQRYLAKDDENDWRLLYPHINPEAIHWEKAEEEIQQINTKLPGFKNNLGFWSGLGTIGDYFKTDIGTEVLVSFNLVDTIMALVKQKELIKYLYHQQEALWNKIYTSYFSREQMMETSRKHILKGYFEV